MRPPFLGEKRHGQQLSTDRNCSLRDGLSALLCSQELGAAIALGIHGESQPGIHTTPHAGGGSAQTAYCLFFLNFERKPLLEYFSCLHSCLKHSNSIFLAWRMILKHAAVPWTLKNANIHPASMQCTFSSIPVLAENPSLHY